MKILQRMRQNKIVGRKEKTMVNPVVLSFLLSCMGMYLFLSYSQVLSTGKYSFMEGDLLEIYAPAVKQFWTSCLRLENPFYSWTNGMGMNIVFYNSADTTGSIFNIFYLLLYGWGMEKVTALVMILKTGTIGACFTFAYQKLYHKESYIAALFSLFYALSAFQVYYCLTNIIWQDALFLLPLLILSIVSYVNEGKWKGLLLLYAYLFIFNFYMGYIVGILSFFFFALYLTVYKRWSRQVFLKYCLIVLWAVGLSMVVLLPTVVSLLKNPMLDATRFVWHYPTVLDIMNQLFIGQINGVEGLYPYIYCGVPCLLLAPLYFCNSKLPVRERRILGISIGILLLFMLIPGAYLFIHAFDSPDGWGFRFSFVLSFAICFAACREAEQYQAVSVKKLLVLGTLAGLFYTGMRYVQLAKDNYVQVTSNTVLYLVVNLVAIFLWIGVLALLKKNKDIRRRSSYMAIVVLLALVELVYNAYLSYGRTDVGNVRIPEDYYYSWQTNTENALAYIEDIENTEYSTLDRDADAAQNTFYRINSLHDFVYNSDTYFGYPGVTDFSTAENFRLRKSLENLGMYSSPRLMLSYGLNPVTRMLLAVKYEYEAMDIYRFGSVLEEPRVERNPYYISLGFLVDPKLLDFTYVENDIFQNCNNLLSAMTGEECQVYEPVEEAQVTIVEDGIHKRRGLNQWVLDGCGRDGEMTITYLIPKNDKPAYSHFYYGDSQLIRGMPYFYGGIENDVNPDGAFGVAYMKQMEETEDAYYVKIGMGPDSISSVYYEQANFYYYNEAEMERAYECLRHGGLQVQEYKNGYVRGTISSEEPKLLFTSIPYDENWSAYVNGEEVELLPLLDQAFTGLMLMPGEYEITFVYRDNMLIIGALISLLSVAAFAVVAVRDRRRYETK